MKPLQTGVALAITLIVFYSLCTAIASVWPDPFIGFVNALFHGLDFRKLAGSEPYTLGRFLYALVVFAIWGLAVGAFFAWIHQRLSRTK